MFVLKDAPTAYFDCDETLVIWNYSQQDICETIEIGCPDFKQRVLPHSKHIAELKNHKARGHKIVVWSAGGSGWAHAVVEALELSQHVDIVVGKPNWFYDDLAAEYFMPEINRYYTHPRDLK